MPIYEYECRKCKAHTEAFQKVTDKPLTKCRKCGGRLDKRISAPAIQFKGSGWYVTDYAGKATKGEQSESQTTSETSTEKTDKKEGKLPLEENFGEGFTSKNSAATEAAS